MKNTKTVRMSVALKYGDEAQTSSFSRAWTARRIVLKVSSGRMALLNLKFLVADEDLTSEDLLIGLPVLRHLPIDTKTFLENNRSLLDGMDCNAADGQSST